MSKSDTLRREYESMGKQYPGDRAAAKQQLRLAKECRERALSLDPTLRETSPAIAVDSDPTGALDAATEAIIERAIRTAHKSSATRSTSRKVNSMRKSHGFDADALFQRDPDSRDRGPDFARAYQSRNAPRLSLRDSVKSLITRARTMMATRRHAMDSDDREEVTRQIKRIENHLSVRGGTEGYDPQYVANCFKALWAALGEETAEDEESTEEERDFASATENSTNAHRYIEEHGTARLEGRLKTGRDSLGQTPARSVVSTEGARRDQDHRRDFNSIAQGGADSSLEDFDSDSLFQKG